MKNSFSNYALFNARRRTSKGTARRAIPTLLWIAAMLAAVVSARAQSNLVPNPDFNDPTNPLKGWRIDFPDQGTYVKNAGYVKISPDQKQGSANAVEITLPKAVAENEGGKIESAFIPAKPGGTYRASVQCITGDFSIKVYCDAYALDPTPPGAPNMDRILAHDGMPALVRIYRGQFPDVPAMSKTWTTSKNEFKIPAKVLVGGKPEEPNYIAFRVFVYSATTATVPMGKADFTRFQLMLVK